MPTFKCVSKPVFLAAKMNLRSFIIKLQPFLYLQVKKKENLTITHRRLIIKNNYQLHTYVIKFESYHICIR